MNKFDWDKFRNEKVAVNCRTEEAAKEFIEECYKRGMKWFAGTRNDTWYSLLKEKTAYTFNFNLYRNLGYADTHWYEKAGYEIVEYTSKANEEQTEFTFQEVIARIKPGEIYCECNKGEPFQVTVRTNKLGEVFINFFQEDKPYLFKNGNGFAITRHSKFKLQEPKNQYTLVEVIHAVNGKHYTFRASDNENLKPRDFVVCDTSMGKTFGRVAGTITKELTEKEYLEFKECWRAE